MHATLRTSFKVKGQGHKLTSSVCKVSSLPLLNSGNKMLYLAIGGGWGHTMSGKPGYNTSCSRSNTITTQCVSAKDL